MTMTSAGRLLARLHEIYVPSDNGHPHAQGTGLAAAGVTVGIAAGLHMAHRAAERRSLAKAGFVNHPYTRNLMIHPDTGQTARIPRWYG